MAASKDAGIDLILPKSLEKGANYTIKAKDYETFLTINNCTQCPLWNFKLDEPSQFIKLHENNDIEISL